MGWEAAVQHLQEAISAALSDAQAELPLVDAVVFGVSGAKRA